MRLFYQIIHNITLSWVCQKFYWDRDVIIYYHWCCWWWHGRREWDSFWRQWDLSLASPAMDGKMKFWKCWANIKILCLQTLCTVYFRQNKDFFHLLPYRRYFTSVSQLQVYSKKKIKKLILQLLKIMESTGKFLIKLILETVYLVK